jgi:hypothetical protein
VIIHPRTLVAIERRVFILQEFFFDGQKVVVVVVMVMAVFVGKLVAGCGLLGLGVGVVAISPGPCMQTPMFRVATAVVEE